MTPVTRVPQEAVTAFLNELGKTDSYIDDKDPDWIVIDGIYTSGRIGAAIRAAQTEPSDAQVQHLIGHVKLLIHDLEGTRTDGSVLTAGYLIHRLNAALAAGGSQ